MARYSPTEPVDVLLVEDNPGDVRLTREAFESIESEIQVRVVRTGTEAMEYLEDDGECNHRPDIVLLDLNLPRIDGLDVLERLHDVLEYPPPPILVLSSSATKADVVESYDRAANAYLTKPSDMTEFHALVHAIEAFWIDSAQHPPAPA